MTDSEMVKRGIADVWSDLEKVAGDQWKDLARELLKLLRQLGGSNSLTIRNKILKAVSRYPSIRRQLIKSLSMNAPIQKGLLSSSTDKTPAPYMTYPVFYGTNRKRIGSPSAVCIY